MRFSKIRSLSIVLLFSLVVSFPLKASAQTNEVRKPIDMMILIDNSCSMFPANQILAGCDLYGSDPDFLRIVGADLFIARLGFAEPNEAEYQVGVISVGDKPDLITPLQPISGNRDQVAKEIANPQPQLATRMVPALQMAYDEFHNSPNRRLSNLPAIVLITDGIPWPTEGQGFTQIEDLISKNADTPLFVLLLQNQGQEGTSSDYQSYIQFWQQLQTRYNSIFVYLIKDATQIEETYNGIIGQLQNTIPTKGIAVSPDQPLEFYVSNFLQKVIVTVIHSSANDAGKVQIKDSNGDVVQTDDPGVGYFRGKVNPVEVYSISSPRLKDELKDSNWTITSSTPVTVLIDREGTYQINFLSPISAPTDITNVYRAVDRQSPSSGIAIKFNLLDSNGGVVKDPQRIQTKVINPSGQTQSLQDIAAPVNGTDGVYELDLDPLKLYPQIGDQPGRFIFVINAGQAGGQPEESVPIASARLLMDVGRIPYIRSAAPQPLVCGQDWHSDLRVSLGDYDVSQKAPVQVRVFSAHGEVYLQSSEDGVFSGDLTDLCQPEIAVLTCSTQQNVTFTAELMGQFSDGTELPSSQKSIQVQVITPACTPTPLPTSTSLPPPPPTPVPDRDGDGVNDLQDRCPDTYGLAGSNGCLPVQGMLFGLGGAFLLVAGYLWVWPLVRMRVFTEPPKGYILVCRSGAAASEPISLFEIGEAHHTDKVTIGGSAKADLVIEGLDAVEFVVERREAMTAIRDAGGKAPFAYFDQQARVVRTSDPKVILRIGLDPKSLKC